MNYTQTTIWDVVGRIPGTDEHDDWVVAGNHRDAWVYGAVDPNSGTAAMLEAVHGLGALLKSGWKPKRTIYICSWDAEEEGLIGSTEWVEDHARQLAHAVAYFNTDVGVSGPEFEAAAVPSLKQYVRDVASEVPSPKGGSVLDAWKAEVPRSGASAAMDEERGEPAAPPQAHVGDLGSGSDFTPFLQHAGVPSTDIGSRGKYGVYHSVFDNYAWFTRFADPTFVYEQQQARIFGLEILHIADADVLPYDYSTYAKEIAGYLKAADTKAHKAGLQLDFARAIAAVAAMQTHAEAAAQRQKNPVSDATEMNARLRKVEDDLLDPQGLPGRAWFHHTVYAPGEYTGYAAVVIPGVNEAIEANNRDRAQQQLDALTAALDRASADLKAAAGE
jgi:N-acetylated-alpha-linked acidic dipeptidase